MLECAKVGEQACHYYHFMMLQVEPKQALMKGVADAMAQRAAECNPQEISNCVWAFARLSTRTRLSPALYISSESQRGA